MAGQELVYEPDFPDKETIQAAFNSPQAPQLKETQD